MENDSKDKEKKKYKKKNEFEINIILSGNGEKFEELVERAFSNYCLKRI